MTFVLLQLSVCLSQVLNYMYLSAVMQYDYITNFYDVETLLYGYFVYNEV